MERRPPNIASQYMGGVFGDSGRACFRMLLGWSIYIGGYIVMRLLLELNGAGDLRLKTLRDKPVPRQLMEPEAALLVCSSKLPEMTTSASQSKKTGYGKLPSGVKFTRYGRQIVREAGAALDAGRISRTVFLTGTLPGSTLESFRALAAWSAWTVKTLLQWILDTDGEALSFGVWEFQKRGALHLHLCIQASSSKLANEFKLRWKARWIRILDGIGRRSGIDLYSRGESGTWSGQKFITRTDAQTVEKSCGRYLSKYLSKGSVISSKACATPPARWWFISAALRRRISAQRISYEVRRLSIADAIESFEKIGGEMAADRQKIYAYRSPYDCMVKGVIALCSPIEASLLFDRIKAAMRIHQPEADYFVKALMEVFAGSKLLHAG